MNSFARALKSQRTGTGNVVDADVATAKRELSNLRRMQTEYFIRTANKVAELRRSHPESSRFKLKEWLQREVGFSRAEAKAYIEFDAKLGNETTALKEHSISPDSIRAIMSCDPQTKAECLLRMKSGERVHPQSVARLKRATRQAARSPEQTARSLRDKLFKDAALEHGFKACASLQGTADELLDLMDRRGGVGSRAGDRSERIQKSETADLLINEVAGKLLADLKTLFPSMNPEKRDYAVRGRRDIAGLWVSRSWRMLSALRRNRYEPAHLACDGDDITGVRACVEFLAGKRAFSTPKPGDFASAPDGVSNPLFIDIDAGIGGTALGLEAAGFRPVALFPRAVDSQRALETNRPSWTVKPASDFALLTDVLFEYASKNVDLLTSGLPWHHHVHGQKVAYANALIALEIVKPKTFLFEGLEADRENPSIVQDFVDRGYDAQWHTLDVSRYGLAQAKARHVLLGARDRLLDELSMPAIDPPEDCGLADAIGDLVSHRKWDETEEPADRDAFENALHAWMSKYGRMKVPEFPQGRRNRKKQQWRQRGIRIDEHYVVGPPSTEELETGIRLNPAMLKRLQTFPDSWKVGPGILNANEIAGAFPPQAAKIVGMAIHSALAGVHFDYKRAVRTSLVLPAVEGVETASGSISETWTRSVLEFLVDDSSTLRDRKPESLSERSVATG
ncbi:DNA cytosine methyltransferase [Rhizobium laguerreae]|uniref:DNA cytosine methyltransferase n=1 Tax=Rhizobium laguerreae TaxID=1076926 RepID=UPI001C923219|nr:DNA cytosine methyltransferase [Rhizobium laguerreae]MBY3255801.1 DNA cytosine methyltransferase [Rhizobium laguerreae]MBY3282840.1 DNA cytosine methyltransferase [Rhizobium laguerreae]MBY3289194.1 DNA cytosine methyltransferase [Rhizobium laguerreae]